MESMESPGVEDINSVKSRANSRMSLARQSAASRLSSMGVVTEAAMKTETLRVLLVMAPLIVCLIALATYTMVHGYEELDHAQSILEDLYDEEHVRELVDSLEDERAATCFYLQSLTRNGNNSTETAFEELDKYRNKTDSHWHNILHKTAHTQSEMSITFSISLETFRRQTDALSATCQDALDKARQIQSGNWMSNQMLAEQKNAIYKLRNFYTKWVHYFLVKMLRNFPVHENKEFFILYTYFNAIQIKDLIELKRAEGAMAFVNNSSLVDQKNRIVNFIGLSAILHHLYNTARAVNPQIFEAKDAEHKAFILMIEELESDIINKKSTSDSESEQEILVHLAEYRDLYSEMEVFLSEMLVHEVSLMAQLSKILLYQMLPKSIVRDLLAGNDIPPQYYESVSVMFIDITDFQDLSTSMSPYQITYFLNSYYNICDDVVQRYKCYKVEVVLAQYVVASGVPVKHITHSDEVCTMALDLHRALYDLKFPTSGDEPPKPVNIVIGCHTGSIATGIVGMKMPKYCLFGDAVNTAARMQSTCLDGQIQIGASCRQHLQFYSPNLFHIVKRGTVNVKGKGEMETYWVLGKIGVPFHIKQVANDSQSEQDQADV